jgi:hypothetical protein
MAPADVIRAFQGPVRLHDCVSKESVCPDDRTCPLRKTLARLETRRLDAGTRNSIFCSSPWKSPTSPETGGEEPPFHANAPI